MTCDDSPRRAQRSAADGAERAARPAAVRPRTALGVLERLEGDALAVHAGRCVEVRNRNAGCHACADACTSGAIGVADGLLSVDPARCIGCGTCATVCPTCALEAQSPSDAELLARAEAAARAAGATCVFACSDALDAAVGGYDPAKVAEVRCLGRVDESLIAELAARGVERFVLVGRGCDGCAHVPGRRAAERVASTAEALLEAWGAPVEVAFAEQLPAQVTCERWSAVDRAPAAEAADGVPACACGCPAGAGDPAAAGVPAVEDGQESCEAPAAERALPPQKVGRTGTLPHHVPNRRGRLFSALATLGEPAPATLTTRLWASVSIDAEACSSCRACAVFCPTGALRAFDDRATGTMGVEHEPAKCVACGCCRDVCPHGAIALAEEVFAPDLVDGHVERIEMRPPEIVTGKPTTVVNKMRKILGANQVNFA